MSTDKRKFNNCAFVSTGTFLFFVGFDVPFFINTLDANP
jgi:hypothetical protein